MCPWPPFYFLYMTKWKYDIQRVYKTKCENLFSLGDAHVKLLYRYMDLGVTQYCFTNRKITFSEFTCWPDQYDSVFYQYGFKGIPHGSDFVSKRLHGYCFSSNGESEAALKSYVVDKKGKSSVCARISVDQRKLRQALSSCVAERFKNARIYECRMNYGCNMDTVRRNFQQRQGDYYRVAKKSFDMSTYLSLLAMKRKTFAYEGELRYIIDTPAESVGSRIDIPNFPWKDIVTKVEVDCSRQMADVYCPEFVESCVAAGFDAHIFHRLNIYELREI